jgi:spermidine synthase
MFNQMKRSRTVFARRTALSGRIRVIEDHVERRLIVSGDTLSVYPLGGDWTRVRREYWWHALAAVEIPPRPSALFVGLGGGTQIHLLRLLARPRRITVIERDPAIIEVARRWFGLADVAIEYLCGDAHAVVRWLGAVGRRFDLVVEDALYASPVETSLPLARALVPLLTPRGALVINRHWRFTAHETAAALRPFFTTVVMRRIRREGENVLIGCTGPKPPPPGAEPPSVPDSTPA